MDREGYEWTEKAANGQREGWEWTEKAANRQRRLEWTEKATGGRRRLRIDREGRLRIDGVDCEWTEEAGDVHKAANGWWRL